MLEHEKTSRKRLVFSAFETSQMGVETDYTDRPVKRGFNICLGR